MTALVLVTLGSTCPAQAFELKSLEHGHIRYPQETSLTENGGTINLENGEVLIETTREMTLNAGQVRTVIERGAVVLAKREGDIFEIATLYARGKGDVHVVCGKRTVDVLEAERLYVGPSAADVIKWVREAPGHRRVIKSDMQEGSTTLLLVETPPVAILQSNELLRTLKSSTSPRDKKLYNRLVKMAACVTFVRGRRTQ